MNCETCEYKGLLTCHHPNALHIIDIFENYEIYEYFKTPPDGCPLLQLNI